MFDEAARHEGIVPCAADGHVARAKQDRVIAIAAIQKVSLIFVLRGKNQRARGKGAIQPIMAAPAHQRIGAKAALQVIIPVAAGQNIVPILAKHHITFAAAIQAVIAIPANKKIGARATKESVVAIIAVNLVCTAQTAEQVITLVSENCVRFCAAFDAVGIRPACDRVIAHTAQDGLHFAACAQHIIACAAVTQIIAPKADAAVSDRPVGQRAQACRFLIREGIVIIGIEQTVAERQRVVGRGRACIGIGPFAQAIAVGGHVITAVDQQGAKPKAHRHQNQKPTSRQHRLYLITHTHRHIVASVAPSAVLRRGFRDRAEGRGPAPAMNDSRPDQPQDVHAVLRKAEAPGMCC